MYICTRHEKLILYFLNVQFLYFLFQAMLTFTPLFYEIFHYFSSGQFTIFHFISSFLSTQPCNFCIHWFLISSGMIPSACSTQQHGPKLWQPALPSIIKPARGYMQVKHSHIWFIPSQCLPPLR